MTLSITGPTSSSHSDDPEKHPATPVDSGTHELNDDAASSQNKQEGVKQVEAITTVFSKKLLITMFIL